MHWGMAAATDRSLNLVYNPIGPSLPPAQASLEADYKRELGQLGLQFDHLLTLANMLIQRFARQLELSGELESYQQRLQEAHNPDNLDAVMCRSLISVDWTGRLFDCDFNQQLGMACTGSVQHLRDLLDASQALIGARSEPITTASDAQLERGQGVVVLCNADPTG